MIKEHDLIKTLLRSKYPLIRQVYKQLACVTPSGIIASIGMNQMTDLILQCDDLVDYKILKTSDCDLAFITTLSKGSIKYPNKPEQCFNPER